MTLRLYRPWIPYLVLSVTLLLTTLFSQYVAAVARAKDQLRFEAAVQQAQTNMARHLETYIELLRSGRGLFAAAPQINRQQFRTYIAQLRLRQLYPGVQGIGYSLRFQPHQKAGLLKQLRRQGMKDFHLFPATPRAEYHAIVYLEPLDRRNKAAIGYDMFTEAHRRTAMEQARDTGNPAASQRVVLVQEITAHKQAGFLIYVPIYRTGQIPATVADRQKLLQGFIYSPFRVDDLLNNTLALSPLIDVEVYDDRRISPEHQLYNSQNFRPPLTALPQFTTTRNLDVAGQPWHLVFYDRPELGWESEAQHVPYLFGLGVLLSGLLFSITRSLSRAQFTAETAVLRLRQSEIRFRTLMEQSPLGMQIFTPTGEMVQCNHAWEQLWGTTLAQRRGYNILQDQTFQNEGVMRWIYRAFSGIPVALPPIVYQPLGSPNLAVPPSQRWLQVHIYPVRDAQQLIREVVVIYEDITQRKLAEAALKNSHDRLQLLYSLSSNLLLQAQPKTLLPNLLDQLSQHLGLEVYLNYLCETPYLCETLCETPSSESSSLPTAPLRLQLNAYGGIADPIVPTIATITVEESLCQALCGSVALDHQPMVMENLLPATEGPGLLMQTLGLTAYSFYPLMAQGQMIGILAFGTRHRTRFSADELTLMQVISDQVATAIERVQLLETLQQQTEELRQANRMKDEFLTTLSHELRTPLNAMQGWATLLQARTFDAATTNRGLAAIERNTRALAQTIGDILDVSRMITGKLHLQRRRVAVLPIVEAAIARIAPATHAKGIQLICDFGVCTAILFADPVRLQQVFHNLLSNAVKFTPSAGQITLRLQQQEQTVQVQITDTGTGITADFLPHVFDHFRQSDGSTTRPYGGLGLGLAIARYLVEHQGGTIQASSPGLDQGATFTVTLPISSGESRKAEQPGKMPGLN